MIDSLPLHATQEDLAAGLSDIRQSPSQVGTIQRIVCRPATGQRTELVQGQLALEEGLVGDSWKARGSSSTPDGQARLDMQLTLMNSRAIALIARTPDRWALAGDQLFVDFDLSEDNVPAGTRLAVGTAILEVTPAPHTGCKKFAARFGQPALKFVNSAEGKQMHLRGINARVVEPGWVKCGDAIRKVAE